MKKKKYQEIYDEDKGWMWLGETDQSDYYWNEITGQMFRYIHETHKEKLNNPKQWVEKK